MDCRVAQSLLHAYLDGELDASATVEYEQHVRTCPACAQRLAEQKAVQTAMKSDALYFKAPEHLRDRLRSSLGQQRKARFANVPWRWVAAAACLLFCVGLGFLTARFTLAASRQERMTQEVASSHIRSLQVENKRLVDIPNSDRHEVKPWLSERLDFSPPVLDLAKQGFPIVGGRLDYLDGRPVAAVVYQRRKHVINVFLWPDTANQDTQPRRETRQGYHLIEWQKGGMNHWVVSDLDPTELNEFVQGLRD
jgi:anti-sigma factor (TIGR02949 family)